MLTALHIKCLVVYKTLIKYKCALRSLVLIGIKFCVIQKCVPAENVTIGVVQNDRDYATSLNNKNDKNDSITITIPTCRPAH